MLLTKSPPMPYFKLGHSAWSPPNSFKSECLKVFGDPCATVDVHLKAIML